MLVVESASRACPCCTGLVPFRVALTRLLRRLAVAPARLLLIEGGAEGHAAPLKAALGRLPFTQWIAPALTVAVIDLPAFAFAGTLALERLGDLAACADLLVANKGDLADDAARARFESFARASNAGIPRIHAIHGAVEAARLRDARPCA